MENKQIAMEHAPKPFKNKRSNKNKKSLNTSQNSKGSAKTSNNGSIERDHLAREIK